MSAKEDFETARKYWPGLKRGLETEFANFQKKHKNWKEIAPLLLPAMKREEKLRAAAKKRGEFFPGRKMFATWINQSCWELEQGEPPVRAAPPDNYRQKARDDFGDWLRSKTTRALEDMLAHPNKDGLRCGLMPLWLIQEILKERHHEIQSQTDIQIL